MTKEGIIYKIVKIDDATLFYIGSTFKSMTQRLANHRYDSARYPERKIYKCIASNGGWENHKIESVESIQCENSIDLKTREEQIRRDTNPAYNDKPAYDFDGNCRKNVLQKYYDTHRAECLERGKQWRAENLEMVQQKRKELFQKQKEEKSTYYDRNKVLVKEKQKEKIVCTCSKLVTKSKMSRHTLTAYHIQNSQ